ncbi:nucleotidyltransferase domain-containing protein [Desulfonatronospira sp.]|uniref:type VII toxin-antitoxin system MntA family adenylyltransferase antitoxin n=1 Tax=Desulfonatronospira sp. TaxID=1962951 RepID=UPI0025B7C00C|nr:nucleotidyltransferase domain-containing protein [Desulfonatronospira sp.]
MPDKYQFKQIIEHVRQDERILALYLMGSAATGKMRPDSDVDLAVLVRDPKVFNDMDRLHLAGDLAFRTGLMLDIGEISSSNLVYAKEALLKGQKIFVRDESEADLKACTLLGMYIVFNEARQRVLRAYES